MNFDTLDDAALCQLHIDVLIEQERRRTLTDAPIQAADLAARYATAIGREDGDQWVAPTGAHNVYPQGGIVTHQGKTWESLIPNNVWTPGDPNDPQSYQWWTELSDDEGEPDPDNGPAGWSPNSHDYTAGDRVTYDGAEYECVQPHTSQPGWAPDVVPALWAKVH